MTHLWWHVSEVRTCQSYLWLPPSNLQLQGKLVHLQLGTTEDKETWTLQTALWRLNCCFRSVFSSVCCRFGSAKYTSRSFMWLSWSFNKLLTRKCLVDITAQLTMRGNPQLQHWLIQRLLKSCLYLTALMMSVLKVQDYLSLSLTHEKNIWFWCLSLFTLTHRPQGQWSRLYSQGSWVNSNFEWERSIYPQVSSLHRYQLYICYSYAVWG